MTVNAVRRSRRRTAEPTAEPIVAVPESLAIGEIDQTVFDCPNCGRPLAVGARRCPGCRTRLVIGVPMSKASLLASSGLAIGLALGGVGGAVFGLTHALPAEAAPIAGASAAPLGGGSGGGATPGPLPTAHSGGSGGIPSITGSALVQAVTVNARLRVASGVLSAALARSTFDAASVAQTLRMISADTIYGGELADKISAWPGSAAVGEDLGTLYDSIHSTATEALVASVTNTASYRQGAKAMVRLLASLSPMDAQIVGVATTNGVVMPGPSAAP